MKQRWQQSLLLIALILSQSLCSFARQLPPPQKSSRPISIQQSQRQYQPVIQKRISRQADDFGSTLQMIQLGMKYLPIAMNLFSSFTGGSDGAAGGIGGSGGGGGILDLVGGLLGGVTGNTKVETSAGVDPVKASAAAATNTVDRIDPTDLVQDDPFSVSNLIRMGIKVALAVFSSYTNDDIDRIDKVSPTQAILGTVISAVTGSENPQEVAVMAKQATDVINLLVTLVEAIGTSITS